MDVSNSGLESHATFDLVGGSFSVIESDPGVFTSLLQKLGVKHLQFEEVYDIQTIYALSSLRPKALILCFVWQHDKHHPTEFHDPAAKQIWFANQLSDDACASLAILNVINNLEDVDSGEVLKRFKDETSEMSSVMKGLAVTNLHHIREAQNSLARPSDRWASQSSIAKSTAQSRRSDILMNEVQRKPKKRSRGNLTDQASDQRSRRKKVYEVVEEETANEVTYHFIGYVPSRGKVWELDGFKAGPLEVGEIPTSTNETGQDTTGWEEIVLPALKMKMEKYGSGNDEFGNIQFSLLALVEDKFEMKSDTFELGRREVNRLERRLLEVYGISWSQKVHPELYDQATAIHKVPERSPFRQDFAFEKQSRDLAVLNLSEDRLVEEWESAVRRAGQSKRELDEEIQAAKRVKTEHVKRTHDYDSFARHFIEALNEEGLLGPLLKP